MGRCRTPPPHIPLIGTPQYIYIYSGTSGSRKSFYRARSAGQNPFLQGRMLFCRAERFSVGQNAVLPGRMKDHQSYSIYILWHLSVAKIVLPSRRAFCAVLPSRIAFCRVEQYSAGQNEGSPTIYISIFILWHLRVTKIVLPVRMAFCQVERRSTTQNEGLPIIYILVILGRVASDYSLSCRFR